MGPTALGVKETSFKRLPLHISTQFGCCFDVVQYLVEQYPAAALEADTLGRLPIHYSCSNGAPLPIIRTLLQANSAATLTVTTTDGFRYMWRFILEPRRA